MIVGEYVPCVQGDDVSDGFDETAKKLEVVNLTPMSIILDSGISNMES